MSVLQALLLFATTGRLVVGRLVDDSRYKMPSHFVDGKVEGCYPYSDDYPGMTWDGYFCRNGAPTPDGTMCGGIENFCQDIPPQPSCPNGFLRAGPYIEHYYTDEVCATDVQQFITRYSYWWHVQYEVYCAACEEGSTAVTVEIDGPQCPDHIPVAEFCYRCTEPWETLTKFGNGTYGCIGEPPSCGGARSQNASCPEPDQCDDIVTMSAEHLGGSQVVVAKNFKSDVEHLLSCARAGGASAKPNRAGLEVQSTSRCDKSPSNGLTPAKGISAHQLGKAIDTNLRLPNGRICNRTCMGKAYCAFNNATSGCINGGKAIQGGSQKDANNIFVRDFLACAGSEGLEVGAEYRKGDWNHFERDDVANKTAALNEYQPQLKNFCLSKCPGLTKGPVNPAACSCKGYS